MRHGLFVGLVLFGGELTGTFIKLRGHVQGLVRRTAERDENFGEFGNFHATVLSLIAAVSRKNLFKKICAQTKLAIKING
jgi:hypothetical protein